MLKEHNIRMYMGNYENDDYDAYKPPLALMLMGDYIFRCNYPNKFPAWDRKIYVHPDCHEVLLPKIDDYGGNGEISGSVAIITDKHFEILLPINSGDFLRIPRKDFIIERRNGKAFFAPESEEIEEGKGVSNDLVDAIAMCFQEVEEKFHEEVKSLGGLPCDKKTRNSLVKALTRVLSGNLKIPKPAIKVDMAKEGAEYTVEVRKDGWINWDGKPENPIPLGVAGEAVLKDGTTLQNFVTCPIDNFFWDEVVKYRIFIND